MTNRSSLFPLALCHLPLLALLPAGCSDDGGGAGGTQVGAGGTAALPYLAFLSSLMGISQGGSRGKKLARWAWRLAAVGLLSGCGGESDDCFAPVTFHITGRVTSLSGPPVAGSTVTVCVTGQYCEEHNGFSYDIDPGCDPPNRLGACGDVTLPEGGMFTIDLPTDSPDKRDSPRNVRVTLSRTKGVAVEGESTSSGCGQFDSVFSLP